MKRGNKVLHLAMLTIAVVIAMGMKSSMQTDAVAVSNLLGSLNMGAAILIDADITLNDEELDKVVEKVTLEPTEEKEESKLIMANVKESMNIRAEADEDSEKVGMLYKDCGGEIVERANGWTKIKSGDLVGWAKDEYLLFGDDAEKLAGEVGNLVAKVDTETLRVRTDASETADTAGLLAVNDEVIALENKGDWVSIDFDGQTGYVDANYVKVDFKIDHGETMKTINDRAAEIEARKAKAAEEKAKVSESMTENRGAVSADISDAALLAALIQCEAGGESYEGQLAVGAVVINRLRSGAYPSSIQGVIYASGQFTPALNGKVDMVAARGAKASCQQAAIEALNGASNVGTATHFKRSGSHDGYVIGNHVFW
ncbi:MAG: cell wall hydrolase [Lachnospiraceae bacterium]|nr:cell wall hydrolase [Lachnospiraceae bacterium]